MSDPITKDEPGNSAADETARAAEGANLRLGNARALLEIMALALSEKTLEIGDRTLAEGLWGVRELIGHGMELLDMTVRL